MPRFNPSAFPRDLTERVLVLWSTTGATGDKIAAQVGLEGHQVRQIVRVARRKGDARAVCRGRGSNVPAKPWFAEQAKRRGMSEAAFARHIRDRLYRMHGLLAVVLGEAEQ